MEYKLLGQRFLGLFWVDNRYLWFVNGCLEYHRPIITKADLTLVRHYDRIPEITAFKACTFSSYSFWRGEYFLLQLFLPAFILGTCPCDFVLGQFFIALQSFFTVHRSRVNEAVFDMKISFECCYSQRLCLWILVFFSCSKRSWESRIR